MSKKQRGNTLKFDDMLVSYDYKKDIFTITSKDEDLAGKPFQITLNNTSDTENSIREIFVEKGIIQETENVTLPLKAEYQESGNFKEIPLGVSYNGNHTWNIQKTPNLLINGHVGSGSTVFTRTIIKHCDNFENEIDLKLFGEKIEYDRSTRDRHKVYSLFHDMSSELLNITNIMEKRYKEMDKYDITNIDDLPNKPKRIVIIVNDFYYLMKTIHNKNEKGHFIYLLEHISSLGRAAGISIVIKDNFSKALESNRKLIHQFNGRIIAGNTDIYLSQRYLNSDRAGRGQVQVGYAYSNFNENGKIEKYPTLFSMCYLKEE